MFVDIIESFDPSPMKRPRETINLSPDSVSKCGELFVTNTADKWIFFCSYCQKASNDIGVFICHIRWEHLNGQQKLMQQQSETPELETANVSTTIVSSAQNVLKLAQPQVPVIQIAGAFPPEELRTHDPQQPAQSDIIKEEETIANNQENTEKTICSKVTKIVDITALTQPESNETENFTAEQTSIATTINYATNRNVTQIVYTNDKTTTETNDNSARGEANDYDIDSVYSVSDDEDKLNIIKDPELKRGLDIAMAIINGTANKKRVSVDRNLLPHKCRFCNQGFKSKQGLYFHTSKIHEKDSNTKLPFKCDECKRGFKSLQGLKDHKITHDTKSHYKCPLCPARPYKLNIFINHVLTHESDTCFPCQVCGKVYKTNKERMQHWHGHAKERPFGCQFCYRRFRKQQYLTHHLKSHNRYLCNFCLFEFDSSETQRPPYVCEKCVRMPDIKQKVEHQRSLACNSHVFESDED